MKRLILEMNRHFYPTLKDIINQTPSAANIVSYANIVREQSIVRQLIQIM